MTRPKLLDLFCGEGGASMGYHRAGFDVTGVDNTPARLNRYPFTSHRGDAITYLLAHGHQYDAIHASPPCTGYTRGTAAIPDRLTRYDRLIAATREALNIIGRPYIIENVADARPELHNPVLLCGRQFGLSATDDDGTHLVLDRHRLFESSVFLMVPPHQPHDPRPQVAGSYGGARRDKREAREVRRGGYVPTHAVQAELLGVDWMSEKGCQLSIPPAYTQHIGEQFLAYIQSAGAA
jgi:DNA (cytosine-5)-methyltransferase 1